MEDQKKNPSVWRKTGQPQPYKRNFENDRRQNANQPSSVQRSMLDQNFEIYGKRKESQPDPGVLKNAEVKRPSTDLVTLSNDPFAIESFQYGNKSIDGKVQNHVPKFKDAPVDQRVEKLAPISNYNQSDLGTIEKPTTQFSNRNSIQGEDQSSEKAMRVTELKGNKGKDAIPANGEKTLKTSFLEGGMVGGKFDTIGQNASFGGFEIDRNEQRLAPLKLPALPFKINDTNRNDIGKVKFLPGDAPSLGNLSSKSMNNKEEVNDPDIEAIMNENKVDSSRQWFKDKTKNIRQRRATVFSKYPTLGYDPTKKLLQNEAYCMQKMHFTNNPTFSFFNMHPSYEEHNESLAAGANRVQITKFKPKSKKPRKVRSSLVAKSPKPEF